MKKIIHCSILVVLILNAVTAKSQSDTNLNKQMINHMKTKKVLFVVTSFDKIKATGKPTGIWIEEFAAPFYLFASKGIEVTIASPKGGKAPIDPKSTLPDFTTDNVKRFFSDASAQERLNNTLKLEDINPQDYDAVFYPGGHGPMWDLPENKYSIAIIETLYNEKKPVALVCHAPAALQNVKDKNGDPLVKGKKIAGFTNSEEIAGQSTADVPFMLEDMLKGKGANYQKGTDWQPFAVNEGQLITGQNPASSELVAEKIIELLQDAK